MAAGWPGRSSTADRRRQIAVERVAWPTGISSGNPLHRLDPKTFQHLWPGTVGANLKRFFYRSYPRLVGRTGAARTSLSPPIGDTDALHTAPLIWRFDLPG